MDEGRCEKMKPEDRKHFCKMKQKA